MASHHQGRYSVFLAGLALVALIFCGCSKSRTPEPAAPVDGVAAERVAKDASFRGDGSPIPVEERSGFRGLSYYPVNSALKFRVQLNRYPVAAPVRLATNTGEIRSGLRYGFFEFEVDGMPCKLQVYRLDDSGSEGPSLFIPFRDATSGTETYGPGRYIDLKENTSGIYDLDFNRAYNPFCAYSDEFSCPLAPAENTLAVAIRAGEKNYAKVR